MSNEPSHTPYHPSLTNPPMMSFTRSMGYSYLLPHVSLPLVSMSHTSHKHCLPNNEFDTALKAKLCIDNYPPITASPICFCGQRVDAHGNHFFSLVISRRLAAATICSEKNLSNCPILPICRQRGPRKRTWPAHAKEAPYKLPRFDWQVIINHAKSALLKKATCLSVI